ncbi:MAG: DUF2079 domain-containing protein [Anaerolineae bacterium]
MPRADLMESSKSESRRKLGRSGLALGLVWLLMGLYVVGFGTLSILKHEAFQTHAQDLGNMDQPIWNTLHGRFLEETKNDGSQGPRLTDHFEPIFALVSLSFLIYDDVKAILVLQTVVIALGALPVFWLARDELESEAAGLVLAAVYLLFPALQAANVTEFHAAPLAVSPLLFTFHYAKEKDWPKAWLFAILAMSAKEEITLLVFMLGLYALLVQRERLMGGLLALVSLAWFGMATFVIIPHFSTTAETIYTQRYTGLGGSFKGIVLTLLTKPWVVVSLLLSGPRLAYLGGLLASVGFLSLFDPPTLLLSAPIYLANALSDYPLMYSGQLHYSAPVVPFFVVSAIYGAKRLVRWLDKLRQRLGLSRTQIAPAGFVIQRPGGLQIRREQKWNLLRLSEIGRLSAKTLVLLWLLLCSLGYQRLRGFTPLGPSFNAPRITPHHRLFQRFAAQIPPDAVLSTTPPLFPHLTHRRVIYLFPVVLDDTEYVLLDVAGVTDIHPDDFHRTYLELVGQACHEQSRRVGNLSAEGEFGILDSADGYILLQRSLAGPATLPDGFYDFARVEAPTPNYPMIVDFGDSLRLLGFDLVDDWKWQRVRVRLYWQVLREMDRDYQLYLAFLGDGGEVLADTVRQPMTVPIWYPTSRWRQGEVVATETLLLTGLGDSFTLGLGVFEGEDWEGGKRLPARIAESQYAIRSLESRTWVRLLSFRRERGRLRPVSEKRLFEAPSVQHPVQASFAAKVSLLGYDLDLPTPEPGGTLRLILYWQAQAEMDQDYTVFVHLLDAEGRLVAQHDGQPGGESLPTSSWVGGEVIADEHPLGLDLNLPPGSYLLEVGLYLWPTMERLPVLDGAGQVQADKAVLGEVRVGDGG